MKSRCAEITNTDIIAQEKKKLAGDEGDKEIGGNPLSSAGEAMTHIHEL